MNAANEGCQPEQTSHPAKPLQQKWELELRLRLGLAYCANIAASCFGNVFYFYCTRADGRAAHF